MSQKYTHSSEIALETVSDDFEVSNDNCTISYILRKYNDHHSTLEALHAIEIIYQNSSDPLVTEKQTVRYIESISNMSMKTFQRLRKDFFENGHESDIGRAAANYGYLVYKKWNGKKWILAVCEQRVQPYYIQESEFPSVATFIPDYGMSDEEEDIETAYDRFRGLTESQDIDEPYLAWLNEPKGGCQ